MNGCTAVVHLAGKAIVSESILNPDLYMENNHIGTINILKSMKSLLVNKLIFSSTCAVYGNPISKFMGEDHPTNPINPYGESKLQADKEIKQFSKSKCYNIPIDSSFMNNLAEEDFKSISNHLNSTTKKLIILTHFPPTQTGTINPVYKTTDLKNYFAWNNILEILNLKNVILWISGHTHWSYNFKSNGIQLLSNQVGYASEQNKTGLFQDGFFKIDYTV